MTRDLRIGLAITFALTMVGARSARAADPTTAECLSANEASLTARSQQKLRDAREKLLVCAARSCPGDVRDECTRGVNELNAALPTIVFEAKDADGADLIAVKVTMDGETLTDHLDGTAIAVDPGAHTFSFETPGHPKAEKKFVIREGEKGRREQIVLGGGEASAGTTMPTGPAIAEPSPGLGGQRIGALVAGGAGVVAIGVGTVFGLRAKSKHDDAQKICPDRQCPNMDGVKLWNDAISAGNIATVAFVVGAVGIAGGAVLWFTGGRESSGGTTQVGLGPGTFELRGTW